MHADQSEQYWSKFEKAVNSASHFSIDVEGFAGDHIRLITKLISNFARGLNENWPGLWEEKSGKKSRPQQQADAIVACREVQKAIKHLIEIFQFRKFEHNNIQVERPELDSIPQAEEVQSTGLDTLSLFHTSNEVKEELVEFKDEPFDELTYFNEEEPTVDLVVQNHGAFEIDTSSEIKEELLRVKEEPIDEPIADIYCPSTGIYYPKDAMGFNSNVGIHNARSDEAQPSRPFVFKPVHGANQDAITVDRNRPFFMKQLGYFKAEKMKSAAHMKCFFCNKFFCKPVPKSGLTPYNPVERKDFLNRITTVTEEEVFLIEALKKSSDQVYFCNAHIMDRNGVDAMSQSINCYLCDKSLFQPVPNSGWIPYDSLEREKFLKKIVPATVEDIDRIEALRKNKDRVFFCTDHIIVLRDVSPFTTAELSETRKELREEKISNCGLCGAPTKSTYLSPLDPSEAQDFFDNVLELSPYERSGANFYVKQQRRVIVCIKHFRLPSRFFHNCRSEKYTIREPICQEQKGTMLEIEASEVDVIKGSRRRKMKFQEKLDYQDKKRYNIGIGEEKTSIADEFDLEEPIDNPVISRN